MKHFKAFDLSRTLPAAIAASLLALVSPALAADEDAPKGEMVTVIKAAKSCFANIVEVSGFILAQDEKQVRPERMGLKVADVLAEAGDTVTAGQTLARLNLPEGGSIVVQAPVAGIISEANATIGAFASLIIR
jgi:HlyD family secretion protein